MIKDEKSATPAGPSNRTATELPAKADAGRMFDRIAQRYDLLNRLLSVRRDVAWRKRLADMLPEQEDLEVLDLATGTADVLLTLFRRRANLAYGIGADIAGKMLAIGREKVNAGSIGDRIELVQADALALPFADAAFDVVTIAFGIRNVTDVSRALEEMRRVLRPGGTLLILEFSMPRKAPLRAAYLIYFRHVLPRLGAAISGDASAYRYLNRTVEDFPHGEAFCDLMRSSGFTGVAVRPLTFGIASIYSGVRM